MQPIITININNNISPIRVKVDAAQDNISPSYKELVELTKLEFRWLHGT